MQVPSKAVMLKFSKAFSNVTVLLKYTCKPDS